MNAAGLLLNSLVYAGAPLWTYSAPNPASVAVAAGETATVSYVVTNNSVKSKNLILQATAGVSASPCYLAGKGSTCTLILTINGSAIPQQGLHSGPVLCEQGNPNQCYQPALDKQLNVNKASNGGTGHLLLTQSGLPVSSLSLHSGDSGTLLLTNTGAGSVSLLTIQLPFGWNDYFTSNCLTVLEPRQSCTINYLIPLPSATGILNPLSIQAINADNSIRVPVSIQTIGAINCWGLNSNGQLGNGIFSPSINLPVSVLGISDAIAITGGVFHTCALLDNGAVNCWGANTFGQLGDDSNTNRNTPVAVIGINNSIAVTAGSEFSCALLVNGTINCWGNNFYSQLGDGSNISRKVPVAVNGISNAIAITGGISHTCALLANGTINCWGRNNEGQLGNGNNINSTIPVAVSGINNAVAITAGSYNTCALLANGTINCWGYNLDGELGNGTTTSTNSPVAVSGINNAVAITAGTFHTCALLATGTINCWGRNLEGQLGNGNNTGSDTPVAVSGITNAIAITGGIAQTCTLLANGEVNCWGDNSQGQLGIGNNMDSNIPVQTCAESGCPTPLNALAIFNHSLGYHSCAIVPAP